MPETVEMFVPKFGRVVTVNASDVPYWEAQGGQIGEPTTAADLPDAPEGNGVDFEAAKAAGIIPPEIPAEDPVEDPVEQTPEDPAPKRGRRRAAE